MIRLFALAGAIVGGLLFGKGVWIYLKARLAQLLLAAAWTASQASGEEVRPWPWADTHPVARLSVPGRGVERIALAGASGRNLAFGPGWLDGTAAPGERGNVVLAGHRDTHFAFLARLEAGDEIVVEGRGGRRRSYRVEAARVVDHRDTRWLEETAGDTLTLITCYPFDAVAPGGPLRYLVRAGSDRAPAGSPR